VITLTVIDAAAAAVVRCGQHHENCNQMKSTSNHRLA